MANIYTSADQLIGKTPLLELTHIEHTEKLEARILAKLEYFNPAGSVKDRVAKEMECYLNSSLQESYALTPVSTLLLTPDTRTLLQEDNYPERFADWFCRFTYHITHHFQ